MSALRVSRRFASFVVLAATVLSGCTFHPDGTITRSNVGREPAAKAAPAPAPVPSLNPAEEAVEAKLKPEPAPATPPAMPKSAAPVARAASAAAGVTVCCKQLSEVAAIAPSEPRATVTLTPATPHFDFGNGAAPFAVYALASGARTLQIFSPLQKKGLLEGGDNRSYFVESAPVFLDAGSKVLAAKELDAGQRWWGASGDRALYRNLEVPAGATRVVIASNPKRNDKIEMSTIYGTQAMPLLADHLQEFKLNGFSFDSYTLSTYGPVILQVNR